MKTLIIRWQRLLDEQQQTCPRCAATGDAVQEAANLLQAALQPLGIAVQAEKQALERKAFEAAPLESNRVWIGGKPLEHWVGAEVGQSPCCDACGDADCRTVTVGSSQYEALPSWLIVRAGLLAAADLMGAPDHA